MYLHNQKTSDADVQERRRAGGRWLRAQRMKRGLSQRELAAEVGADYYTFISQLENGRGRIPPDRYRVWAEALDIPVCDLVFNAMRFYDPVTFESLFGHDGEQANTPDRFHIID
ncbi:MAG: helix-turn-helix domain-containing protein [Sandaracinaceae bacterium]